MKSHEHPQYEITQAQAISADLTPIDYDFTNMQLNGETIKQAQNNTNDPNHDIAIIFTIVYKTDNHKQRRSCQCVLHNQTIYKIGIEYSYNLSYNLSDDREFTADIKTIAPLVIQKLNEPPHT